MYDFLKSWLARFPLAVTCALAITLSGIAFAPVIPTLAQGYTIPSGTRWIGKMLVGGDVPVGTGCTIAAGSTNMAGKCTTSATSGSIAFSSAYVNAPFCNVVDSTATPVVVYATTTAQITLTTVTNAHVLFWNCVGS